MLACAAVLALAGCTSAPPDRPRPSGDATGSVLPTGPSGQGGTGLIPPDSATGSAGQTATNSGAAGRPAPPPAATLTWLSGPAADDGLQVTTDAGKRWQGPVPGEWAVLDDQGYRWFGPDGSVVGCTSQRSCVGVDGDGNVVVTTRPKGLRVVFASDGRFLGRFSAAGDRMSTPSTKPTLADAVADSGVDLPSLLNEATLAPPFAGGATGDPHLITAGGVRFTTQVAGQFVARGGDRDHTIQLQLEPMAHRDDVSVVSAVAVGTGEHSIEVHLDGTLSIDGTTRPWKSSFDQVTVSGGLAIGRWPADENRVVVVAVLWPDGGSVVMSANPALGITVVAHLVPVSGSVGLFGAGGQAAGPDLLSRKGTAENTGTVLASWEVTESERLFAEKPAAVSGFPKDAPPADPGAAKVAAEACGGQGIQHAEDVAACEFDVALTGDPGFVPGHVELALPAERPAVAATFAQHWPALTPGSLLGAATMPSDGRLSLTLGSGKARVYRMTLAHHGVVTLINRAGCGVDETPPGLEQAAMRVFDVSGHAVSDRFALCGHEQTPDLPAGTYNLVVVNGPSTPNLFVRVDVTLP